MFNIMNLFRRKPTTVVKPGRHLSLTHQSINGMAFPSFRITGNATINLSMYRKLGETR